ncbi:TetR/AcrR family transcriptional regulator [Nocardioides sp. MH1]|uniref:TetR/AcrR family transcriptional regulator n=1 Tax=Nocardioides sp. MH1 TaxID=3242490 RepID=UPI003520BC1B
MSAAPGRRTQEQRRAETIGKLVEATIESIEQVGYHRTSLGEVCARSGVSKGGLFRHFDSRLDLIIAAAEEVARRHMVAFDELRPRGAPALTIEEVVAFARQRIRHETNVVWFEVMVAARTEPDLRERLAPITKHLYDAIEERAVENFEGLDVPEEVVRLAVTSAVHMFDGEAIVGYSYPRPEVDAARADAAVRLLRTLGAALGGPAR